MWTWVRRLVPWGRGHGHGRDSEARDALHRSTVAKDHYTAVRAETAERAEYLRQARAANHFTPKVIAAWNVGRGER